MVCLWCVCICVNVSMSYPIISSLHHISQIPYLLLIIFTSSPVLCLDSCLCSCSRPRVLFRYLYSSPNLPLFSSLPISPVPCLGISTPEEALIVKESQDVVTMVRTLDLTLFYVILFISYFV